MSQCGDSYDITIEPIGETASDFTWDQGSSGRMVIEVEDGRSSAGDMYTQLIQIQPSRRGYQFTLNWVRNFNLNPLILLVSISGPIPILLQYFRMYLLRLGHGLTILIHTLLAIQILNLSICNLPEWAVRILRIYLFLENEFVYLLRRTYFVLK